MNRDWQQFLTDQGAVIDNGRVAGYAGPARPAGASHGGCVLADLSHWGVIGARGDDAASFLQGQLTGDIRAVTGERAQISGYCNPKGRLVASFYVFRHADAYGLCLPAELAGPVITRLNKFKLRARVELQDMDEAWVRIGLAGEACEPLLRAAVGGVPATDFASLSRGSVTAVRLPGPDTRFLLVGGPDDVRRLWVEAAASAAPVGAGPWELLEIRAGVPMIRPETQEKFVPQMVNLDALQGISFKKGCYTGQEIVARMHYLGRLKQRMYLARIDDGAVTPAPGDLLYGPDADTNHSIGTIVAAQPVPGDGALLLAVVNIEAAQRGIIRLGAADGPELTVKTMPYKIDDGPERQRD